MIPLNNADKAQIRNLVLAMWIFENKMKYIHAHDYRNLGHVVEAIDKVIFEKEGQN